MKVWFTTTAKDGQYREDQAFIDNLINSLHASGSTRYQMAKRPEDADIIVFFEPNQYKGRKYARALLSERLIRSYPNKCFVVNYDDVPVGYLPGVYVGMPLNKIDHNRFKAGCYMRQYNTYCPVVAERRDIIQPALLFSFRGSNTATVRKRIFAAGISNSEVAIRQTAGWFNHTDEEKRNYLEEMLNSKFVLCPRGRATVSIRLFETMELGRVPVILSDQWVAPDGPSWQKFSIRVEERDIAELPSLLKSREPEAAEMGRQARIAWEQWFSPSIRVTRALGYIEDLMLKRPLDYDERDFQKKWLSASFAWESTCVRVQEIIQQGRLFDKIKSKFLKQP